MSKHETAFPSWYITFQQSILANLPRPPHLTKEEALEHARDSSGLKRKLHALSSRAISYNKVATVEIPATDGTERLGNLPLGTAFQRFTAEEKPTRGRFVDVLDVSKRTDFHLMLIRLSDSWHNFALTQGQIRSFLLLYEEEFFADGNLVFFIFKTKEYLVPLIIGFKIGHFGEYYFLDDKRLDTLSEMRIVVPRGLYNDG